MERIAVLRLVSAAIAFLFVGKAFAQSGTERIDQFVVDQLLNNVVTISATINGSAEYGLGFIIGRAGDVVWIATAAHVAFPKYEQGDISTVASNIEVRRRNDSRLWKPIQPPDKGFGGDIAFIGLDMPLRSASPDLSAAPDLWREAVVIERPAVGVTVRIAGRPNEIAYGDAGGRIADYDASGKPDVRNLVGERGQSGGPVATPNGFVGMYVQSIGDRFVSMSAIRDAAQMAGHPWQLSASRVPTAVRLCLTITGFPGGNAEVNTPRDILKLDSQNCVNTVSGNHRIIRPSGVICAPDNFTLSNEPKQSVQIICSIDPTGQWASSRDGFLTISPAGSQLWNFVGLSIPQHGWIRGMMRGESPNLYLDGSTQSNAMVTGKVTLEARRMSGRLLIGGTPYDLDLTR